MFKIDAYLLISIFSSLLFFHFVLHERNYKIWWVTDSKLKLLSEPKLIWPQTYCARWNAQKI